MAEWEPRAIVAAFDIGEKVWARAAALALSGHAAADDTVALKVLTSSGGGKPVTF